jgi:hypothetical protein
MTPVRIVKGWTLTSVVGAGWYTGHGWEFQIVEDSPPYWQATTGTATVIGRSLRSTVLAAQAAA